MLVRMFDWPVYPPFTRRFSLIPGLRVSLGKRGPSVSIGHRGVWYTVGRRGGRATARLPRARGLYWTERVPPARPPHGGHRAAFVVVLLVVVLLAWRLI
jgi:hypothetical protein